MLKNQIGLSGQVVIFIWMPGNGRFAGHVATAIWDQNAKTWVIVISPFPSDGHGNHVSRMIGPMLNITKLEKLKELEKGPPTYAFVIDVPDMGAWAGEALTQLDKGLWCVTKLFPNSTQCAVASSLPLMVGGAEAFRWDGRTAFGLPKSLGERLLGLDGTAGVRSVPEIINQMFGQ